MSALGELAYVGKLHFKELSPPFKLPRKKIVFAGYFNNIFSGASNQPIYMEWTNKTAIGGGNFITPMTVPFKCELVSTSFTWYSLSAINLTGVERADFRIGTYTNDIAGGVGNPSNFNPDPTLIYQITSSDNGTFPTFVNTYPSGTHVFNAGDAVSIECREQGTITPTDSEMGVCCVFEIIED